jgi:hypothetical protein
MSNPLRWRAAAVARPPIPPPTMRTRGMGADSSIGKEESRMNEMASPDQTEEQRLLRERVEIWKRFDTEMVEIRRRDAESVTLQEAIRQIFEGARFGFEDAPKSSGLVEQQMWFSRIREAAARKTAESDPQR